MSEAGTTTLEGFALLASLSMAERERYARLCRWRRYGANEQIIDSQSDSRDVFFVVKGMVRVVNYSLSGREVTLDNIGAGGYFGQLAAIDGSPRSANVMACEDTLTAAMPPEQFCRLVSENAPIGLAVMNELARLIRQSTDRIMDLSTLGANNRVHAELLRLAGSDGGNGQAIISPIPSHSEIASRVSTTRETVARALNDLARAGIVRRDKDALVILDLHQLEDMVQNVRGDN